LSPPLSPLETARNRHRVSRDCRAAANACRAQQISVTALLASEVFPARSTAFTVNVFAPLAVA
jgi:hypothetical protein